jgi:phosphopantothenoylcysteine synthetase/decarboxylase
MEEMEVASWLTLDAIKKSKNADIVETVGNLQTGHSKSVFCVIEDDFLELCYNDAASNALRRFENRDEFDEALEERKEDDGEALHEDETGDKDFDEDEDEEDGEDIKDGFSVEEEPEIY